MRWRFEGPLSDRPAGDVPVPVRGTGDGRVFHAEPFGDDEIRRTAPTLRAPTARRKVRR